MKTALYENHLALGAKMVNFAGWDMPVQYTGIIPEHLAVRNGAGIFDVSHMGRILVEGNEAEKLLDYLSTNKIAGKPDLSATYTVWANASGSCVDDVIVYKQDQRHFFVVVNASNRQKDLDHLKRYSQAFDVKVHDLFSTDGILAVQGPKAFEAGSRIFPEAPQIKPMTFLTVDYHGQSIILSGTGYTGAGGFEVYAPFPVIVELWDRFLKEGILPAGLGARDTLRLEMGYALYGHELDESIYPSESVSSWTVKWNKRDFLGKEAMQQLEGSAKKRTEYGIVLLDKGIAREGYSVFQNGSPIGKVTSGTQSPSLNKAIAIILVEGQLKTGDRVEVQIRQNRTAAQVVPLPFYQK